MDSKETLSRYLLADKKANGMISPFRQWITFNDNYRIHKLLRLLRHVEFYKDRLGFISKLMYGLYLIQFRRYRLKTDIMIFPNTFGPGLQIMHPGFRRLDSFVKCGANCTVLPMVLLGRKRPTDVDSTITIGDNCYISTGVTILGPVTIGNNVTIAAGAVVIDDVPDNAVVGGVPAKILKYKNG